MAAADFTFPADLASLARTAIATIPEGARFAVARLRLHRRPVIQGQVASV